MTAAPTSVLAHVDVMVIEINGVAISGGRSARVVDFSFDEKEKSSAEAEFTVVFSDQESFDATPITKGMPARVRFGYVGQLSPLLKMKVHTVEPHYENAYSRKVTLRDLGDGMGGVARQAVYANTTLGDVVQGIASQHSLVARLPSKVSTQKELVRIRDQKTGATRSAVVPPTTGVKLDEPSAAAVAQLLQQVDDLHQAGRTDRALLHWIAHRVGCELHVDGNEIKFLPPPYSAPPRFVFLWNGGQGVLKSFGVKAGEGGREQAAARGVSAAGVDPLAKQALAFTAGDKELPGRPVLGKTAPFAGVGNEGIAPGGARTRYIDSRNGGAEVDPSNPPSDAPAPVARTAQFARVRDQKTGETHGVIITTASGKQLDVERNAKAAFKEAEGGGITAEATIIGIPSVRRRSIVEIRGVNKADAGKYMVTACSHKIGLAGYLTTMELKRHGENSTKGKQKTSGKVNQSAPRTADPAKQRVLYIDSSQGAAIVGVGST